MTHRTTYPNLKTIGILSILLSILTSCYYGVNQQTSEIGTLNTTCLSDKAWDSICKEYSTSEITDSSFKLQLENVKNHFIKPDYILYFNDKPKEIIGCDYYSVRVVYNPAIADQTLSGLDPILSDQEQVRIRNRIQQLLMKYQCDKGKEEAVDAMKEVASYSKTK